ncbi:MAG TPA: M14 family zinc carboxypeptidase [Symbiobacteriaceae bacterium]
MPYRVQPGDTLWAIAQRFGVPLPQLLAANPHVTNPALIHPGLVIHIPLPASRQYIVRPGDTLWAIARAYGITLEALQQANPGINPYLLQVGQVLNLPGAPPNQQPIVIPRDPYGYQEMTADLNRLQQRYPFIEIGSIGNSVLGRSIPVVRLGTGPKEVHYCGAVHGEEWITAVLLMKFIEQYAAAYAAGEQIGQFHIPTLFRQTSLWVVPMVNPDGVELSLRGIDPSNPYYDLVVEANGGSLNFRTWAANIRGVDLNDQFPANWEREAQRGVQRPAPRNYAGTGPLTEPEAIALADFTRAHDFRLVIAWHSQGQVIYWGYEGMEPPESEWIANLFADVSGYQPIRTIQSWAGYKDWFIQDWRRPGFTVEVGRGINPLPIDQFWPIWGQTIGILLTGLAV